MAQADSTLGAAALAASPAGAALPGTGIDVAGAAAANTFDNPNFIGPLYRIAPRETPFLALAGGINGGKTVMSKDFTWQLQNDPDPGAVSIQEGADPAYESFGRGEISNTVQIFQYGVEVTYTKLAAYGQLGPQASATAAEVVGGASPISGSNPVTNELIEQLSIAMARMRKDVEYAFLNGTHRRPLVAADDGVNTGSAGASTRQTQGILGVASTSAAADALTNPVDGVNKLLTDLFDAGAPLTNVVFMAPAATKVDMTAAYASRGYLLPPRDRMVAGLALEEIVTDFGTFPVAINRWMPADTVGFFDMSVINPVHLSIPGKGSVFTEELAQTGAALRHQLYGEMGLEYGPPSWHGVLDASAWV